VSHITVIDDRHALFGQRFEVASLWSGRGSAFVVIRLPDGRLRNIRRSVTDLLSRGRDDEQRSTHKNLISVRTLLPLLYYVRSSFVNSTESYDGYSNIASSDGEISSEDQYCTGDDQARHTKSLEQSSTGISASARTDGRDPDPSNANGSTSDGGAV
jgi:hypothetical protein